MSVNYTPDRGDYKTLQPFRFWCQKVLPLVYDNSLSYYELLNKVVDYLNKTMEDVETLNEDVTALYNAYDQLQGYVNAYFDNLDVQEEINNKLDAMVLDGTFSRLLKNIYGDRLGVEIVDSTSGMTNPTKTYILSNDPNGYLWFWNGTTFEESTINYFNPINALGFVAYNTITDLNNLYRQVTSCSGTHIANVEHYPPTTHGVIVADYSTNANSSVQVAYDFAYTHDPIYYIRKKSSGVWSNWFTVNSENYLEYIASVNDLNELHRGFTNVNTDDLENVTNIPPTTRGIVVVDYSTNSSTSVQLAYNYGYNDDPIYYIRKKSSSTWSDWFAVNPELYLAFVENSMTSGDLNNLSREVVAVTTDNILNVDNMPTTDVGMIIADYSPYATARFQIAVNYHNNKVPVLWLRKYTSNGWSNWFELTGNYWKMINNGNLNDYTYPCTVYWTTSDGVNIANNPLRNIAGFCKTIYNYNRSGCIQILSSWANAFVGVLLVRTKQASNNNWSAWNYINTDYVHNSYGFTVIGDSLCSGVTTRTIDGNNSLQAFNMESWEKILANKIGCKVYACSKSGASTVDWLNTSNAFGITKLNVIPATPVYFINLGVNDYNQTVGEDVFKTNYASIISAIKTKNPNALIFCCKLWRGGDYDTYSGYIEDVLADYATDPRVNYFDIQSAVLSAPISTHLYNGHFDVIGYKLIGDAVENEFMSFANAHPELFRYEFSSVAEGTANQDRGYPFAL